MITLAGCSPSSSALALIPITSSNPSLEVREYPLVEQSKDNPTHLEFQEHVFEAVSAQRDGWRFPRPEDVVAGQNQALLPFGFHLETSQTPPFSSYTLYRDAEPIRSDIVRFWPVSVKNASNTGINDFLLPFVTMDGEKLVASATGIHPWPGQQTIDTSAPVYLGDQIAYAQTSGGQVSVYAGPSLLYAAPEPEEKTAAQTGSRSLYTWGPKADDDQHWALEMDGRVVVDGEDLNRSNGYDEVFEFRVIDGMPFYFYSKGSISHIHYAGRDLPYIYDQIIHGNTGDMEVFNPGSTGRVVWFYALRDGLWYYVEVGKFE